MKNNILAILGPTNTGKTFLAIKKLLSHETGVIGFPLRLLARENYEYTKRIVGEKNVALITGEEKIVPGDARYFFCTVESIPQNEIFEFVAIDEIQLAADYERGYIFTDKLLNVRGSKETVFMGSSGAELILRKIYPDINIINKARLSKLSYSGYKNISRLPKRSAVIAFSQMDVYQLATRIKQTHGGVSIVMGALSPEVRNAQVKLFENGDVDYIVATDAIGLGLNLNIKHIFFSSLVKFDGLNKRRLTNDEMAQIAGRAGRYLNDGFFGTTGKLKSICSNTVNFVENYNYLNARNFYWRNNKIKFTTPQKLIQELRLPPKDYFFKLKRNASDERYFRILIKDKEILKYLKNQEALRKLWAVCGVPDYSKNLDEHHTIFLKTIFLAIIKNDEISEEFIKKSLEDIEKKTNKIAELNYKLSQIRVWSFLSFKEKWVKNNDFYKKRVKQIETNLSISLHTELMSHFVDESKGKFDHDHLDINNSPVQLKDTAIYFGREKVGVLEGLSFKINLKYDRSGNTFKNKILKNNLKEISKLVTTDFVDTNINDFNFDVNGFLYWKSRIFGRLFKSKDIFKPNIKLFVDTFFSEYLQKINEKVSEVISHQIISPLFFLRRDFDNYNDQNFRALNFNLYENLGHCLKSEVINYYKNLEKKTFFKKIKSQLSVGSFFIFYKNKNHLKLIQMLVNIHYQGDIKTFLDRNIYKMEKEKNKKSTQLIYEKIGFYSISIKKKKYLIYFQYLEYLFKKIVYSNRKKIKFFPSNSFERLFYQNFKEVSFTFKGS